MLLLACPSPARSMPARERLAGRGIIISKQPTQGAASKKAWSPALERLARACVQVLVHRCTQRATKAGPG
eukprot:scaffold114327_cov78-Phaeocystis_antarctica.AAC.1